MKTISPESDLFKEINNRIIDAIGALADQTTNDKIIDIYDNYASINENLTRVRLSEVVFDRKNGSKEICQCYVTLYLHGSNVNSRSDIINKFLKAGLADELFIKFGFKIDEISKSRDASRNLGRGSIEDRSSFSFSAEYERFL